MIEKAKKGAEILYFLDASHFVMGAFSGRVWSIVRKWVKTASGRQRFNVLGALNFATNKMEIITNSVYITSAEIVIMLEKLAALHPGKVINIVLDNARYQRCKFVTEKAETLGINLVFLPTYSPNLNLIERVWKLVKSKVLNATYHETFCNFCRSIESILTDMHTENKAELDTLITEKFHIVDSSLLL